MDKDLPGFEELCEKGQLGILPIEPGMISHPELANAYDSFLISLEAYQTEDDSSAEGLFKAFNELNQVADKLVDAANTLDLGGQSKFVQSDARAIMTQTFSFRNN